MTRHRNHRPARSSAEGRKRRRQIEWAVALLAAVIGVLLMMQI